MRGWEHVQPGDLKSVKFPKPSKYRNVRVSVDGFSFDSKAEAARYHVLVLMEKAGLIRDLEVHPKFVLITASHTREGEDVAVCDYIADFSYVDVPKSRTIVEDVKGVKTALYRLKKKWLFLQEGIDVQEIR